MESTKKDIIEKDTIFKLLEVVLLFVVKFSKVILFRGEKMATKRKAREERDLKGSGRLAPHEIILNLTYSHQISICRHLSHFDVAGMAKLPWE